MAAKIAIVPAAEAPVAAPISAQHRASAFERGLNLDGVVEQLRQGLAGSRHALAAIIGAAPEGDANLTALQSLHKQLLHFAGTVDLLAPAPGRVHTLFDGKR